MNTYKRSGNKWTINELLSLQREYELLELTIKEIAFNHQRSVEAILFRLEAEGFIDKWATSRGFDDYFYNNKYVDEAESDDEAEAEAESDEEEESDEIVDKLVDRVWNLEINIKEIGSIVKQIFNNMISNSSKTTLKLST
jgi:hypothetical protein